MRVFTKELTAIALAAAVQMALPPSLYADPPARVARISFVTGDASLRHGTSGDWMAFMMNYPVTTGDELWTDTGSRSELHFGSSAVRLGERTALSFVLLEDDRVVLRLTQGEISLRVRSLDESDHMEIETPTSTVSIMRAGDYRLVVDSLGLSTMVAVHVGDAQVASAGGTYDVLAGHVGLASSDPNTPFDVQPLPVEPADEFEAWAESRARAEDASQAGRYVSMEMTGYEALDAYGHWQNTPEYGDVWVPSNVGDDWAPYRVGRWVWVDPWGWTWIDAEPWGFAPFHYGRWARYGGVWVWAPGVRVARPVYAPALVAFVGGGSWSASARFGPGGGVAWFPLAPGEPWVPSYHASTTYVKNVNITNVHVTNINVTNVNVQNIHYKNVQVAGAVTAVPRETFVGAKPVRTAALPLQPQDVRQIQVVAHSPPVTPRPESRETPVASHPAAPPPRVATHITELHAEPPPHAAPAAAPAVPPTRMNGPGTAVRVPVDPRPRADIIAQQRAVQSRQVLEHAQLQDKHLQEKASAPKGQAPPQMQARQQKETQTMEARHATENAPKHPVSPAKVAPPPKPAPKPKEEPKPPAR